MGLGEALGQGLWQRGGLVAPGRAVVELCNAPNLSPSAKRLRAPEGWLKR